MIRFNPSFQRIIIALIVGVVLVVFPQNASEYLVIALGVVFMLPSIFSMLNYFWERNKDVSLRGLAFPIEGLGGFLFGLLLVIKPGLFSNILVMVFGFLLVMAGVQQIASLVAARRWTPVAVGYYIIPVIILLSGLFALSNPVGMRSTLFKIVGVFFIIYALYEFLNWLLFMRKKPRYGNPGVEGESVLKNVGEGDAKKKSADDEDIEDAVIIED